MPDKVLYWYGNQVNVKSEARPDYTALTYVAPTWNTNNATVTISGTKKYCYIRPNTDVNATKIHCIATTPLGNANSYAQIYVGTTYAAYSSSNDPVYLTHTDSNGGLPNFMIGNGSSATNTHTTTMYALWYE